MSSVPPLETNAAGALAALENEGTLSRPVVCEGVGLHSGQRSRVRLLPREEGGRRFVTARGVEIPATIAHLDADVRATVLANGVARIGTVEHLLAALNVFRVDHVLIEVEGEELPALDGSAAPWCALLAQAGRRALPMPAEALALSAPVELHDGAGRIRAEPAPHLSIDYTIDFDLPSIGRQRCALDAPTPSVFAERWAPARTFALRDEVEALRAAGLGLGGSLDNALVFEETGPVGGGALRFPDECVRHKVVDLLGDLALLGRPLAARVVVERGGHRLHHALVRAIVAQRRQSEPDAPERLADLVSKAMAHPWSAAQLRDALSDARSELRSEWDAQEGNAVSGCVLARWTDTDLLEIDLVAVDRGFRRRGVARRLLASLLGSATARGLREARLELSERNEGALALYQGLGFVVVGRRARYYPDGADALLLSWHAP
jgi:UDP-3-O-[3-hydroxymyristoyl] N-acetylglucosamine deacetylase